MPAGTLLKPPQHENKFCFCFLGHTSATPPHSPAKYKWLNSDGGTILITFHFMLFFPTKNYKLFYFLANLECLLLYICSKKFLYRCNRSNFLGTKCNIIFSKGAPKCAHTFNLDFTSGTHLPYPADWPIQLNV